MIVILIVIVIVIVLEDVLVIIVVVVGCGKCYYYVELINRLVVYSFYKCYKIYDIISLSLSLSIVVCCIKKVIIVVVGIRCCLGWWLGDSIVCSYFSISIMIVVILVDGYCNIWIEDGYVDCLVIVIIIIIVVSIIVIVIVVIILLLVFILNEIM